MSLKEAASIGFAADEMSKKITGDKTPSVARSTLSTGLGALGGMIATETVIIAAPVILPTALATIATTAAAPVMVPLVIAAGTFAFIKSLF